MAPRLKQAVSLAFAGVVLTTAGGLVGSAATNYWTRGRELEKNVLELRQKAYADFFRGQSLLPFPTKQEEANQLITEAKLRILLTGSRGVVCSLVTYWADAYKYPECPNSEAMTKDAAIYQQMRIESFSSLGMAHPELDVGVLVPYLRNCTLKGREPDRVCKSP